MSRAMESCYAKAVLSGGMGFAMGGVFGLFMASVRLLPLPPLRATPLSVDALTYIFCLTDGLRYPFPHPRNRRPRSTCNRAPAPPTAPHRLPRHGRALVVVGAQLWGDWCAVRRHRVRRRV